MLTKNLIWSVVLMILAGSVFYIARGFPTLPKQAVGAGTFPMLIAVLLGLSGLLLGLSELFSARPDPVADAASSIPAPPLSQPIPALLALGAVPLSCAYLSGPIGFTLAAAMPTTAFMLALRRSRPIQTAILCFGFCALIFWAFTKGLLVPLAPGIFRTVIGI